MLEGARHKTGDFAHIDLAFLCSDGKLFKITLYIPRETAHLLKTVRKSRSPRPGHPHTSQKICSNFAQARDAVTYFDDWLSPVAWTLSVPQVLPMLRHLGAVHVDLGIPASAHDKLSEVGSMILVLLLPVVVWRVDVSLAKTSNGFYTTFVSFGWYR